MCLLAFQSFHVCLPPGLFVSLTFCCDIARLYDRPPDYDDVTAVDGDDGAR